MSVCPGLSRPGMRSNEELKVEELQVNKVNPGILLVEKVTIQGGVFYEKEEEASYFDDDSEVREWKTIARVPSVKEYKKAQSLRSKFYQESRSQCVKTPIGLVCKESDKQELLDTINQIKQWQEEFNREAETCSIHSYYAFFRIEEDNHGTAKILLSTVSEVAAEVESLIRRDDLKTLKLSPRRFLKGMSPDTIMELPIQEKDAILARVRAELIRKSISNIKGFDSLLADEAGQKTKEIFDQAAGIARKLCLDVLKRKESLEKVLEEVDTSGITKNRLSFVLESCKSNEETIESELPRISRKIEI
jgi:hypothetical protein